MPIYEYECPTHGRYEVSQRITEDALTACNIEACGKPIRKLISNTSFALKGGGWYATDYAKSGSGGGKAAASADTASPKPEPVAAAGCAPGGCGAPACAAPKAQA